MTGTFRSIGMLAKLKTDFRDRLLPRTDRSCSYAKNWGPILHKQKSGEPPVEEAQETPFYIPGTGASTRPRRTLKHGDCFAVLDSHADIGTSPGSPDGIFYRDTRYLSHLEMLLNEQQALLLGSSVRDDNS